MAATTVRTMLALILERELKMDDEICFAITECTEEVRTSENKTTIADLDLVQTTINKFYGKDTKQLVMHFDLSLNPIDLCTCEHVYL